MSNEFWVGVDLGKSSFFAAVAGPEASVDGWASLPAKPFDWSKAGMAAFERWVQEALCAGVLAGICIESTGRLGWRWMAELSDAMGAVSMVNPARTRAFGESMGVRDKTDRLDACVLALYGRTMRPRATVLPTASLQELRECNRLFSSLSADRQAYAKRLGDGPVSGVVRRELKETIRGIERRMKRIQKRMKELIDEDAALREDVARMTSIPGVGERTAQVILAEIGDVREFSRNELVSFAGLYPRQHESGTSVYKRPRLVRRGGAPVRKALYLCAMSARVHNPQMRALYQRLKENGKAPMAALGAIMRKLLILIRSLLLNGTMYDRDFA